LLLIFLIRALTFARPRRKTAGSARLAYRLR
jgi:hypothetical protein